MPLTNPFVNYLSLYHLFSTSSHLNRSREHSQTPLFTLPPLRLTAFCSAPLLLHLPLNAYAH